MKKIRNEEKIINQILEWLTSDNSRSEIIGKLKSDPKLKQTDSKCEELISHAFEKLREITTQSPTEVVKSHIDLYETIHSYFKEIGHAAGVNKALKAKEKLTGLLKGNKVFITQTSTTTIEEDFSYNTDNLTKPEKERLEYLLKKASS
ncbi:MAG: hypothetical protein CFE25_17150 [Chitinophagaceae bacterium BSSC1]|nr:MAG: hypothetical protein CFE25_17150 [Chitinophagaceae bacterium BSSC1]